MSGRTRGFGRVIRGYSLSLLRFINHEVGGREKAAVAGFLPLAFTP